MDSNFQIQTIKSQIDNMKLQIENIEMQNNNMMNQMMVNQIGEPLLILGIQMLNVGIQTFNFGKSLSINLSKYFDQLKNISEQIINLININNIDNQKQMMQQLQLMQQQQIMQQQIMQQQIMQQQIMQQQELFQNQVLPLRKINVVFHSNISRDICLAVDPDITIKELNEKYYGTIKGLLVKYSDYSLIYNANEIKKDAQTKIKDYFNYKDFVKITVIFLA